MNGALNRSTSSTAAAAAAEDEDDNDQAGHVDPAVVLRDNQFSRRHLPALLKWAQGVVDTYHTFFHVVLRNSIILPASQQHAPPDDHDQCLLQRLYRSDHLVMRRVGSFLGVETGRRLRNAREFAGVLEKEMA